jgi:hypothetical protein
MSAIQYRETIRRIFEDVGFKLRHPFVGDNIKSLNEQCIVYFDEPAHRIKDIRSYAEELLTGFRIVECKQVMYYAKAGLSSEVWLFIERENDGTQE